MARGDVTHGAMARKILKKINGLKMRVELTGNFNTTTLKLAEIFDHPFSHSTCSYSATFIHGGDFNAVTVVSPSLI